MPITALKCQSCGSDLKINEGETQVVCSVCNTANRIEQAVQHNHNYSQHNYKIDSIGNANITLNDEKSIDKRIESANVFFEQFADYGKARELFNGVANDAPGDYRGWWGLVRIETKDLNNIGCGKQKFEAANFYAERALKVAPNEEKSRLDHIWSSYVSKYNALVESKTNNKDNIQSSLNKNRSEYQQRCEQINVTDRYIKENEKKLLELVKKRSDMEVPAVVICLITGFILILSFGIRNIQFITFSVVLAIAVSAIFILLFKYHYGSNYSKLNNQIEQSIARINDLYNKNNALSAVISDEEKKIKRINEELNGGYDEDFEEELREIEREIEEDLL